MDSKLRKTEIILDNREPKGPVVNNESRILRRMFISGILSAIMIAIIVSTLPMTVLSISSLIEYSTIVTLVIFLFFLLLRYFGILILAYLYANQYTFKNTNGYSPFVSIIVPVYNEGKVVKESIKSLLKLDYANYEIIIVNDGSTDDTKEVAETMVGFQKGRYSEIKVSLINKPNGGKAKSLNAGIRYSKADFVLCMDGDSTLSEDTLRMAVRHFSNPKIGAVAGNVKSNQP